MDPKEKGPPEEDARRIADMIAEGGPVPPVSPEERAYDVFAKEQVLPEENKLPKAPLPK